MNRELNHNEIKGFESVLNRIMSKDFNWWIKIKITSLKILYYPGIQSDVLKLNALVNVDEEWARNSFYEWNYQQYPEHDNPQDRVRLGELYGSETGNMVREKILNYFNLWYGGDQVNLIDTNLEIDFTI